MGISLKHSTSTRKEGSRFEKEVYEKLINNGVNAYRSVYSEYLDVKSQSDIVVYNGGCIFIIECKAWNIQSILIDFRKVLLDWSYVGTDSKVHHSHSPILQVKKIRKKRYTVIW